MIYCGTILTDDNKEKKVNIDFEPFTPINTSLYLCDNKFHTEALQARPARTSIYTGPTRTYFYRGCTRRRTRARRSSRTKYIPILHLFDLGPCRSCSSRTINSASL